MADETTLRVLLADDEEAIIHVYSVGLGHYFAPSKSSPANAIDALDDPHFAAGENTPPNTEFTMCRQGEEAVEKVREALDAGAPFDVIVLDIRMPPGIDGVETARRIRELMPDVQVLFVSGFSDYGKDELRQLVPPESQMSYIEKPVRLSELAEKIMAAYERS